MSSDGDVHRLLAMRIPDRKNIFSGSQLENRRIFVPITAGVGRASNAAKDRKRKRDTKRFQASTCFHRIRNLGTGLIPQRLLQSARKPQAGLGKLLGDDVHGPIVVGTINPVDVRRAAPLVRLAIAPAEHEI
jgi:hypothetical protein